MDKETYDKAININNQIAEEEILIGILEELKKDDCIMINSSNDSCQYAVIGEEKANKTIDVVLSVHRKNIDKLWIEFYSL